MPRRSPLLLRSLLLFPLLGCAKYSTSDSARAPMSAGGRHDEAMMEAPGEPEMYDQDKKAEADHDDDIQATSLQAAPSGPSRPVRADAAPLAPEASPGQEPPAPAERKQPVAQQIIYTAELQLSVFKLDDAMQRAEELTLAAGGYVQNMSQGYYVLRIPAPALRGVMDELARLGVVESRTLQARDVTEQYVDLTTRIRVLREIQQQLLDLLKSARNVEEALKVRASLDAVTLELEQAMGRLRLLERLVGFSTLTVRMSQRGPQNAVPSSNDPFPWVDALGVEATEWN